MRAAVSEIFGIRYVIRNNPVQTRFSVRKNNVSCQTSRWYSAGPLYDHHNNACRTRTRQGVYGSTEVLNPELMSDSIPTVPLEYEVVNEHSSVYENKPPMVILHGLFGNRANNRTIARLVNERMGRDVYSLDLRNHGRSPHIGRHDYIGMAADVERWIKQRNFEKKPILMGHSMGAKVAMSVVLRKPDLCSMLVSIDNAPVATQPQNSFPRYVKALLNIINTPSIQTNPQAMEKLKVVDDSPVIRQFLMTILQREKNPETGVYRFKSKIPLGILNDAIIKGNISNWEFNPWVHRWTGPSLFIRGTRSHYVADEFLVDIARFFPNFEVKDIDATHWVNTEKPQECADIICDYIERHEDE